MKYYKNKETKNIVTSEVKTMSKKKIYNKHLDNEKFYVVNKHPGLIVLKNDRKNIYIAIVTGTSRHRHQAKLKHPTEIGVKESFVNNRPVQGKRNILDQRS